MKGGIESYICTYSSKYLLSVREQDPSILPTFPNSCRYFCYHSCVLHSMGKKINSLIKLHIHRGFFHSQELQVLKDCQENLEKKENLEFWDLQDCKGYLDPKAEKVNRIYSAILVVMWQYQILVHKYSFSSENGKGLTMTVIWTLWSLKLLEDLGQFPLPLISNRNATLENWATI